MHIQGIIRNTTSSIAPKYSYLKPALIGNWLRSRFNGSLHNPIIWYQIYRRDRRISQLEQEYRALMLAEPRNPFRLSQIISELGKLWNGKMRDEQYVKPNEPDEAQNIEQLQKAAREIMLEGKKRMAEARNKKEVFEVFIESLDKVRGLMAE